MANKNAKKALEQFKMQAASEVGVNLNPGYNGDLTARQAGSIGGQIVKKMIESYEQGMTKKSTRIDTRGRTFMVRPCFEFVR